MASLLQLQPHTHPRPRTRRVLRLAWAWLALSMMAYGAGLELAQWAVGWRFAEWADLAADAVGVFVAWGLARWLRSQQSIGIESNSR